MIKEVNNMQVYVVMEVFVNNVTEPPTIVGVFSDKDRAERLAAAGYFYMMEEVTLDCEKFFSRLQGLPEKN